MWQCHQDDDMAASCGRDAPSVVVQSSLFLDRPERRMAHTRTDGDCALKSRWRVRQVRSKRVAILVSVTCPRTLEPWIGRLPWWSSAPGVWYLVPPHSLCHTHTHTHGCREKKRLKLLSRWTGYEIQLPSELYVARFWVTGVLTFHGGPRWLNIDALFLQAA